MYKKSFLLSLVGILMSFSFINAQVISETWEINSLTSIGGHSVEKLGNPVVVETEIGSFVKFDGSGDRLLVDGNPLGSAKEFTVEVIFKPDAGEPNITNQPRFIHFQDPNDAQAKRLLIEIRVTADGKWYVDGFLNTDKENLTLIDDTKKFNTNAWMHAAVTYKNDTLTTYVNGEKILSGVVGYTTDIVGANTKVSIGARMNQQNWYSGMVKTLKTTQKALDPSEFLKVPEPVYIYQNQLHQIDTYYNKLNNCINIKNISAELNLTHIELFDILGSKVYSSQLDPAENEVIIKTTSLNKGIYIICFNSENRNYTRKIVLN